MIALVLLAFAADPPVPPPAPPPAKTRPVVITNDDLPPALPVQRPTNPQGIAGEDARRIASAYAGAESAAFARARWREQLAWREARAAREAEAQRKRDDAKRTAPARTTRTKKEQAAPAK